MLRGESCRMKSGHNLPMISGFSALRSSKLRLRTQFGVANTIPRSAICSEEGGKEFQVTVRELLLLKNELESNQAERLSPTADIENGM